MRVWAEHACHTLEEEAGEAPEPAREPPGRLPNWDRLAGLAEALPSPYSPKQVPCARYRTEIASLLRCSAAISAAPTIPASLRMVAMAMGVFTVSKGR